MTAALGKTEFHFMEAADITAARFSSFGDLIEVETVEPEIINDGHCRRFTDLACLDAMEGRIGVSLFQSKVRKLPYLLDLLERHPLGSQCFVPMGGSSYLVVVASDRQGEPGEPVAFMVGPDQSVNIARNVWHCVLTPVSGSGLFAVLDRLGPGQNLEEKRLDVPLMIMPGQIQKAVK